MLKLLRIAMVLCLALSLTACEDSPWVIMTYNILNGAGIDELTPMNRYNVERHGYHGNRFDRVVDVVNDVNPDILAIQEAHQWNEGEPTTLEEFADQTGMKYYFFIESANAAEGRPSSAVFSRFPIIDGENYGPEFSRAGGRVVVLAPGDRRINVFAVHLDTDSSAKRQQELTFLSGELTNYVEGTTILMGDMNFVDDGGRAESVILNNAGMRHPLRESQGIDQIWVTELMEESVEPGPSIPADLTTGTSDHQPLVVEM